MSYTGAGILVKVIFEELGLIKTEPKLSLHRYPILPVFVHANITQNISTSKSAMYHIFAISYD